MLSRSRVADQRGLTLIELLVAIFVLVIGVLGATSVLSQGESLSRTSQMREQAIAYGEQEIEQLLGTNPFASVGMASAPAASTNANDPGYYVKTCPSGAGYSIQSDYQTGSSEIACEPFVLGGSVPAAPQPISAFNGLSGFWQAYVTAKTEYCLNLVAVSVPCLSGPKRITVAVWPTVRQGGAQKPIWVSTVVADPSTRPLGS